MGSLLLRSGCRPRPLSVAASFPFLRSFSSAAPVGKDDSGDFELVDQRKPPADYDPNTFDPSAPQRSPPSDRVWRLVDEVSSLSVTEVAELSCILRDKIGMKEPPVIGIANAGAGAAGGSAGGAAADGKDEDKKQEKTVFELRLESYDAASKIKVIKGNPGIYGLGAEGGERIGGKGTSGD